jgi:hypothetical protein
MIVLHNATPDSPEAMKTDHKIWRFDPDQDRLQTKPATTKCALIEMEIQSVGSSLKMNPKRTLGVGV